jgi:hypothetical protein
MKYSSLLFTVPMILSVVAGFLIFMLVPYWLLRRQRLTPARKIVVGFALIGLLIPLAFEAKYEMTHTEILSQSVWLWPASLGLMALDPYATTSEIVMGFGITTLSNVGLYALIGWIVSLIRSGSVTRRA